MRLRGKRHLAKFGRQEVPRHAGAPQRERPVRQVPGVSRRDLGKVRELGLINFCSPVHQILSCFLSREMENHRVAIHDVITCEYCGDRLTGTYSLTQHVIRKHPENMTDRLVTFCKLVCQLCFPPIFPQDEEKEGSESTTQSGRKVRRVRQVLHESKKGMYVHTLATLFDFIFFGCFGNVYWFSDT